MHTKETHNDVIMRSMDEENTHSSSQLVKPLVSRFEPNALDVKKDSAYHT